MGKIMFKTLAFIGAFFERIGNCRPEDKTPTRQRKKPNFYAVLDFQNYFVKQPNPIQIKYENSKADCV
jgi:hypothetical protein